MIRSAIHIDGRRRTLCSTQDGCVSAKKLINDRLTRHRFALAHINTFAISEMVIALQSRLVQNLSKTGFQPATA